MNVEVYRPKQVHVANIIDRYIFIEDYVATGINMTCFPNNNYCLGIILESELLRKATNSLIFKKSHNTSHYLTGMYTEPIQIRYQGQRYRELCIDFKPMAFKLFGLDFLNSTKFENEPLAKVAQLDISTLATIAVDKYNNDKLSIDELDSFFLSAIREDFCNTYKAINFNINNTISDLKRTVLKSERAIYRFFASNLGLTPYQFLSIQKFQKSSTDLHKGQSIIDIAYSYDMTDSSHLNKLFKKYSGLSPSQFRKQVSNFNNLLLKV